jgi:hypothetical protein
MSGEVENSVSQELPGVVDGGEESFSVDITPPVVKGEQEIDASAQEKKETQTSGEQDGKDKDETDTDTDKSGGEKEGTNKKDGDGDDEEPKDEDLPKGVKKKLDKITFHRREAEREVERLKAENEALKREKAAKPEDVGEKPKPSNFESDGEYIKALTDWKVKKAIADQSAATAAKAQEDTRKREQEAKEEQHKTIQKALQEAAKRYDDFKDVVYSEKLALTESMVEIMGRMPDIGDIAYFLGKNPDKALEIAQMPIIEATIAIKEISNDLKTKQKKTTKAPEPINPLSSTGSALKSIEEMPYPEYKKLMEKREKERRGG